MRHSPALPHPTRQRRGSIPVIVLAAAVLAIGAASALFLTMGTSRLDKHTELGDDARRFGQSAIEEILVMITNNSIGLSTDQRTAFEAPITTAMAAEHGVEVSPVQVMTRPIQDEGDPRAKAALLSLLTAVPDFASPEVREARGLQPRDDWREKARAEGGLLQDLVKPLDGYGRRWREKVVLQYRDEGGGEAGLAAGSGSARAAGSGSARRQASSNDGRGGVDLAEQFAKLKPVGEVGPEAFAETWGEVSAALLENGVAAQQGCASAATDGPASVLANLGAGANLKRSEYRVFSGPIEASGISGKRPVLVSLYAEAAVDRFGMSIPSQPITAQRIVQESGRNELVQELGRSLAAYFVFMYGFDEAQMKQVGWLEEQPDDEGKPVVKPAIFGGIFDARNQVLPFPVACRLARAGG